MFKPRTLTLSGYISSHAEARASQPAMVADGEIVTWREFDLTTRRVAAALAGGGHLAGERVGIVMSNGRAMLDAMVGTMRAGLIAVPLNTSMSDASLRNLLRDADATALVATADHAARLGQISGPGTRLVAEGRSDGWTEFEAWRDHAPAAGAPALDPDSPCNIIYSSGTTGEPKGIVHSHAGRIDWAYDLALALRYRSSARTLIATGLYSNISWASLLCTMLVGGTIHIHGGFDPGLVLATLEKERITNLSMVPLQFQRLLDHPAFPGTETSSMVAMMCCGSPLSAGTKRRLLDSFACGVTELYGLTEGIVTTLDPEDAPGRLASVGRAVQGSVVKLIDESGELASRGEAGEIVGRSRFVMQGYWNNPAATAGAIWVDRDGSEWLRTGDIGRFDEHGFLSIVDRKKDMILSGGQNVYPADLEAVLHDHPAVRECAVIGIPDKDWGETPLALVVAGETVEPEALRGWANARLGKQQRIARVELRGDLPRNANGKVLKARLRAEFRH